MHKFISRSG